MNGIIKNEFYPKRIYYNQKEAEKALMYTIYTCNNKRPPESLNFDPERGSQGNRDASKALVKKREQGKGTGTGTSLNYPQREKYEKRKSGKKQCVSTHFPPENNLHHP